MKPEPKSYAPTNLPGTWVQLPFTAQVIFVPSNAWIGFDLDGTLARTDNPGHFEPPYPLGEPRTEMLEAARQLIAAGITVKIFTARASEPAAIPLVQQWAEKHGLGRLEVTNQKDYGLLRFYDDRAIPFPLETCARPSASAPDQRKQTFSAIAQKHLAEYKRGELKINEDGIYKKDRKPRTHILPEKEQQQNILPSFRGSFWAFHETSDIKLHNDFHHLNSSQALCFNLFSPFVLESDYRPILNKVFEVPSDDSICDAEFEKVVASADWHCGCQEQTNFDFYLRLASGAQIYVELKYSESKFGHAENDARHAEKLNTIYLPRLKHAVKPDCLTPEFVLKHYQLFRNICYITGNVQDRLFLIYPKANSNLTYAENFLQTAIVPAVRTRIRILHLEDLTTQILTSATSEKLREHYRSLQRKYLPRF